MSIEDKINDILAKIEELEASNRSHEETQAKMAEKIEHNNHSIKSLKDSIALVIEYKKEVEKEAEDRKEYEIAAIGILSVAIEARSATPSDLKTYTDTVGIDYDPPSAQIEKAVSAVT